MTYSQDVVKSFQKVITIRDFFVMIFPICESHVVEIAEIKVCRLLISLLENLLTQRTPEEIGSVMIMIGINGQFVQIIGLRVFGEY